MSGSTGVLSAVSRETRGRLEVYADLLRKWQPKINLIAPSTLPDLWARHFEDSAQLLPLVPEGTTRIADMGSGGGFPGLVLAILTGIETHLVESDSRKCAFLREAARLTLAPVTIHTKRLEAMPALAADLVTARALAPLADLLGYAARVGAESGWQGLFLKGESWQNEVAAAQQTYSFTLTETPSRTHPSAMILSIKDVHHVA